MPEELNRFFSNGCVPDLKDVRDYQYEEVFSAINLPDEYSVLHELPLGLKIENQGSSLSCVGQSISKYVELLNYFDEKKNKDTSAKFVYSRIFLPGGGASIRDGMKSIVDIGVCEEEFDLSYENNTPPSEIYMRQKNEAPTTIENAKIYSAKEYRRIDWWNIQMIKEAIFLNKGVVTGFRGDGEGWSAKDGIVRPPKEGEGTFGHAVLLVGWKKIEGQDYIICVNSWGNQWGQNGLGLIHPSYWGDNAFALWTLIDKPNEIEMKFKTIKQKNDKEIYIIGIDNKKRRIGHYSLYEDLLIAGIIKPFEEIDDINVYPDYVAGGRTWVSYNEE